jgi:thiol-disulfide isomerase/thioredoxin
MEEPLRKRKSLSIIVAFLGALLLASGTYKFYLGSESPIVHISSVLSIDHGIFLNSFISGLEIVTAVLLVTRKTRFSGIVCLFLLSSLFFSAAVIAQYKNIEIECGCLPFSRSKFGPWKSLESFLLMIVAALLLLNSLKQNDKPKFLYFQLNSVFALYAIVLVINFSSVNFLFEKNKEPLKAEVFPGINSFSLDKQQNDKTDVHQGEKVIIAFSPTDCGTCLGVLTMLNDICQNNENRVPIIGVIATPYRQAVRKLQQEYNFLFPVIWDSLGVVKSKFAASSKPALILLNDGLVEKTAIVGDPEQLDDVREILEMLRKRPEEL